LGLGLIEGMAAGCCGVGTDVEGVREIITHARNGALVPHLDAQGLADMMRRLIENPEQAAQLAQEGQAHVRATFDKRRMRQEYIALFNSLRAQPTSLTPPG
jgi:glycosyltransferase involved in cell wall biosynthesis